MAKLNHAIAPGRISCQMSEDGKRGRRYVFQVSAYALTIAEACVQNLITGLLKKVGFQLYRAFRTARAG